MGTDVLDVFQHNQEWHKLSLKESEQLCRNIKIIGSEQQTYSLIKDKSFKIIIASSGMAAEVVECYPILNPISAINAPLFY